MMKAPADIPDSIAELRALLFLQREEMADQNTKHEQALTSRDGEISRLREYIRLLKSQRFGHRSERSVPDQLGLFNEAEMLCDDGESDESAEGEQVVEDDSIEVPAHTRRKRGGRRPFPDFIPREEIIHDLTDEQKICANDPSHTLTRIGEEKLEQLAFVPASAKILVQIRPKYACSTCKDCVKTAPMPPQPIPKSMATPSVLAQIATAKFVDGAPLYRQEKMFRRIGIDLSRNTMAFWMIKMGVMTQPIVDLFLQKIRDYDYVLADETPFQVLKENGKRATSKSYLWALRGGCAERPLLYYEYSPSRSGENIARLLAGFQGFMQTDGYAGYDAFGKQPGIVHLGCFAHARRKFDEALRGQVKSKSGSKQSIARQGLDKINKLYGYERQWRDASPDERYALRQEKTKPKLDELREWLEASIGRVSPTSLTGAALRYLSGQWPKLVRVIEDGRVALDTNAVERCIRPFVIGRRNWLFADTPKGATASANIYSLVETAKANGVEPWRYLDAVFERLPSASSKQDIEALLPWRIELRKHQDDGTRVSSS